MWRKFAISVSFLVLLSPGLMAQHGMAAVRELVDMRASSAEQEMERLGYEVSSVDKTSNGIYQYWYNNRERRCVQTVIRDGRVRSVESVSTSECEGHGSSGGSLSLNSLSGMSEPDASTRLQREGYRVTSTDGKGGGRVDMYWYNSGNRRCIKMEVDDDYVRKVSYTTTSYCDDSGNRSSGSYGSRELALSDYRNMNLGEAERNLRQSNWEKTETERRVGYTISYWYNNRDNRCIKLTAMNGKVSSLTDTKTSYCNSSSSSSSGGSTSMDHLQGRDAVRAYENLEDRGFRETKSHKDGGKTYRVWYNSRTGECIKTLSQNKRITEIISSNRCN